MVVSKTLKSYNIITGDETRIYDFDPLTKQQFYSIHFPKWNNHAVVNMWVHLNSILVSCPRKPGLPVLWNCSRARESYRKVGRNKYFWFICHVITFQHVTRLIYLKYFPFFNWFRNLSPLSLFLSNSSVEN